MWTFCAVAERLMNGGLFSVSQMNMVYSPLCYRANSLQENLWLPSLILLTSSCYTDTAVSNIPLFYLVTLFQVAADDLDQGQNGQVTYSIRSSSMSGLFKIDPLTGSVSTAAIMDREIWTQTK